MLGLSIGVNLKQNIDINKKQVDLDSPAFLLLDPDEALKEY